MRTCSLYAIGRRVYTCSGHFEIFSVLFTSTYHTFSLQLNFKRILKLHAICAQTSQYIKATTVKRLPALGAAVVLMGRMRTSCASVLSFWDCRIQTSQGTMHRHRKVCCHARQCRACHEPCYWKCLSYQFGLYLETIQYWPRIHWRHL